MKKLITILLLAISGFASAQTYQLNYPDIRVGNSNTGKIVLRGSNIQFPFLALGSTTDSVLTIVGGVVKKVPRSQFSGGSSYTFNNGLAESGGVVGLGGDGDWQAPNYASILSVGSASYSSLGVSNSQVSLTYVDNATTNSMNLILGSNPDNPSERKIIIDDNLNFSGAYYRGKYRVNLTNRSIVDKEYVDSVAAASGGGGGSVSSVFGRTGAVTAQSSDYDPFYPLLVGTYNNPTWINTLAYSKITGVPAFYSASNPPPSQVQNSLVSSTTLAPSVDAVNTALATKGSGTVTSFSKTDGVGIVSSVTNGTTTPNHTVAVDTTTIRTVANSLTLAQLQTKFNTYLTTSSATATYVPLTRTVSTGNGLSGGGALSSNLTLTADTSILATKANTKNLAQLQTALNTKQNNITLTTTGTSGAATLVGSTLNIPNYATGAGAYVDLTTNQTVDGLKLFKQDVLIDGSTGSGIKQFGFKDADLNTSFDGGFSFDGGYSYLRSGTNKQMVMASYWGSEIVGNTQGATPYAIAAATGVVTDHSLRVRQITTTAPIFEVKAASGNSSRILNLSSSSGTGDYMFVSSAGALNLPLLTASTLLKLDASKNVVNAVSGTDFVIPSGSITGSAATLTTPRTIWGQNFNGSANITGALSGATTIGASGIITGSSFTGAGTGLTGTAASLTAGNATKLATARTIGTTGITSTAASFDGSANVNIAVTAVPGTVVTGNISGAATGTTLNQVLTAGNILTRATSGTTGTPIIEDIIRYGVDASSVSKIRGVNTLSSNFGTGLSFQTNNPATANTNVESMRIMYGTTTLGSMRPLYITNNVSAPSQINGIYYDTDNSGYSFGIGKSVSGTQTNHIVLTDDNNVSVTGNLTAANLSAGTYTPTGTITDGSGTVTSITPLTTHYSRVGNQVTVSGAVTFSTAASNTNVTIELTIPVSSNFGNGYDAFGSGDVASSLTNYSAHVIVTGNPTTDKAIITLNTLSGTFTAYYRYMYTII